MSEFEGKGAIITGGGRGIGLACARLMAQRGGSVILFGHDRELLQRAEETLRTEKLTLPRVDRERQLGAALANQAHVAACATSKGGMLALTRSIAVDFSFAGIRANAVCPGCIDAPMTRFAAAETAPDGRTRSSGSGVRRSLSVGSGGPKR